MSKEIKELNAVEVDQVSGGCHPIYPSNPWGGWGGWGGRVKWW
ncbi:MAG: hypothetical protein ACK5LJ_06755 [Paracoccus sp. (in: a-proteobacteria)]